MTGIHGQDIADHLIGRSVAGPVPFERQQWQAWLLDGSRPDATQRDALLAWLADHPRPAAVAGLPGGYSLHWWALLTRQLAPPAPRDQRGLRIFAVVTSFCLHLGFAVLLVWVALVRSLAPAPVEEDRVAVRYVSAGDGPGGGNGEAPDDAAEAQGGSPAQAAQESVAVDVMSVPAMPPLPALPALPVPVPALASPPEVQVHERDVEMVQAAPLLVAPSRPVALPVMPAPSLVVIERDAAMEEMPMPVDLSRIPPAPLQIPPRPVDRPVAVAEREVERVQPVPVTHGAPVRVAEVTLSMASPMAVQERDVELVEQTPAPMFSSPPQYGTTGNVDVMEQEMIVRELTLRVPAPQVPVPSTPRVIAPEVGHRVAAVRDRDLTDRVQQRLDAEARARQAKQDHKAADARAMAASDAAVGAGHSAPVSGTGSRPAGDDWARTVVADDWSAAGGRGGNDLFDAQGRPRLAGESAAGSRGAPGSEADGWTRERLAAAGTWLKRPPYEHRPTSFDRYWVPNESLLAEWVRKGIKSIAIPVPGTGTSIQCVISVLQFGGGCGLSDPNMQEQPAQARAAPDIPFKRELQEDNGSL